MKRLPVFILVFAVAFTVLFMAPPFLTGQFGLYPLMKVGDSFACPSLSNHDIIK